MLLIICTTSPLPYLNTLDENLAVRVAMAVCCLAQHATPRSTAQHPCALQHNATTGITYT